MKCIVTEPGGKSYEFIFAGETVGEHCLDKVKLVLLAKQNLLHRHFAW